MQIDKDALTNDKQMVNCLKVNLHYSSEANLWFSSFKNTEKDTYTHLEAVFKLQYPLITQPNHLKAERVRALKEWILKAENLGEKTDGPEGSQMYSHFHWANRLAAKVRDTEDTANFTLGKMFDTLPHPIKELIHHEPRGTYKELGGTVLKINIGDLRDMAADHK